MNEAGALAASATRESVTGPRIVAAIIDIVLLAVVYVVMAVLFGEAENTNDGFSVSLDGGAGLIFFVILIGYYLVLETTTGQTLGKKVMKIRVVPIAGQLTFGRVAVRTLLRLVDSLPAFYLLGLLVVVVSKQDQRIGDMAAGTVVVRA